MLQKIFFKKQNDISLSVRDWLVLSIGFSCLLLIARVAETAQFTYMFLFWNLFLAYVPYAISQWLITRADKVRSKWKIAAILMVWLLFIPNSFYIVTDLFHLEHFNAVPKWFDLLLVFSFAWNGILLGIISIRQVHVVMTRASGRIFSELSIFAFMWLIAFGIYLGRYSRYNSWDIITRPFSLFAEMIEILFHPVSNRMEWGMITTYAIFMSLLYLTIIKMSENFGKSIHQQQK
jgi:uncharacterized membrane protein